jgi:hypothetical protein
MKPLWGPDQTLQSSAESLERVMQTRTRDLLIVVSRNYCSVPAEHRERLFHVAFRRHSSPFPTPAATSIRTRA